MAEPPANTLLDRLVRRRPELLRQLEALISVGSPGLYRVLSFFMVQHVYSLADLGITASNTSIAQMAGFFTAIGWATLILVRLPTCPNRQAAIDAFYGLVWMAILTTSVLSVCSAFIALSGTVRFDLPGVLLLLWSWTGYQLGRHYFVAYRRYRVTIVLDIILIALSGASLTLCKLWGLSASCGLALALSVVAIVLLVMIGKPSRNVRGRIFEVEGLQFGLTNFLSGGISLVMSPAAAFMCGATFAGVFSLLGAIAAIANLLPRAIALMKLPELAKRKSDGLPLTDALHTMGRSVGLSNSIVLVISVLAVIILAATKTTNSDVEKSIFVATGFLLALQNAVGMMGIVNSSVLIIFEKGAQSVKINLAITAIFAALFLGCVLYGGTAGFISIVIASIGTIAFRNRLVRIGATKVCKQYENTQNRCG